MPHIRLALCLFTVSLVTPVWGRAIEWLSPPGESMVAGASAAGDSVQPLFSTSGQFVIFASNAPNLVEGDRNGPWVFDVFRRDLISGETQLVSRSMSEHEGANASSTPLDVSADGNRILFASRASNLVVGDTNGVSDLFLRDMSRGITYWVSAGVNAQTPGTGSIQGGVSRDGRFVDFESAAENLIDGDTNQVPDVFRRDLETGILRRISLPVPKTAGSFPARWLGTTPDGRRILWRISDTNSPGLPPGLVAADLRVTDTASGETIRPQYPVVGQFTPTSGFTTREAVLSADGKVLVSLGYFSTLTVPRFSVVRLNLETQVVQTLTNWSTISQFRDTVAALDALGVSADGSVVLIQTSPTRAEVRRRLSLWTEDRGLVPLALYGTGPDAKFEPSLVTTPILSPDGKQMAYLGENSPSDGGVVAAGVQLYLRQLATGTTRLLSQNGAGLPCAGLSDAQIQFTPNSGRVAVVTGAGDLAAGDFNEASDLFLSRLTGDGLEIVSRPRAGMPSGPRRLPNTLAAGGISADGRRVAWRGYSDHVDPAGTNRWPVARVFDRRTRHRQTLEVAPEASGIPWRVEQVIVAAGGQGAAFVAAPALGLRTGMKRVYWRDLESGEQQWVHANTPTNVLKDRPSLSANAMSRDGRYLVYSADLPLPNTGSGVRPWLYDRVAKTNRSLVDISRFKSFDNLAVEPPVICDDGSTAVFLSGSAISRQPMLVSIPDREPRYITGLTNFSGNFALLSADGRWLVTGGLERSPTLVSRLYLVDTKTSGSPVKNLGAIADVRQVALAASGSHLVFSTRAGLLDTDPLQPWRQIQLIRLADGQRSWLSQSAAGLVGNGDSDFPSISADGGWVTFRSAASNLVSGDDNQAPAILVADVSKGTVGLAVRSYGGGLPKPWTVNPLLASDAPVLTFGSWSPDLISDVTDSEGEVMGLGLVLTGTDSDQDELPDDWEKAQFGNLAATAGQDFDQDGVTNQGEYLAGTIPTDPASALRIERIEQQDPVTYRLSFRSTFGVRYQIQMASVVAGDFASVGPPVDGTGQLMQIGVKGESEVNFYRITAQQAP